MQETNQIKLAGLKFAKSLQTLLKTAIMFSPGHAAVNPPLQNSFDQLNEILKQFGQFTIGFVDQRIMLNNVLTTEPSLKSIETDFLKRGIGAVTFSPGLSLANYRKLLPIMAVPLKELEEGGIHELIRKNPIEFVRVIPAMSKPGEGEGDRILHMDSESYLRSKALGEMRMPELDRIEMFLQSSGIAGAGEGGPGSGSLSLPADLAAPASASRPETIDGIVESYFTATVMEGRDAAQHSYAELARVIAAARPEMILAAFPPKRREQLRQLPPEQRASEVIEDTAVKWVGERLVKAPPGSDGVIVEDEVLRVLLRTLQVTEVASRLVEKLVEHVREFKIPESTINRLRGELEWSVVPPREKTRRLLQFKKFEKDSFRRLLTHLQDLLRTGDNAAVAALANHYLSALTISESLGPEELARLPELVQALATLRSEFWANASTYLCGALSRFANDPLRHLQVLNALSAIAWTVTKFEEFDIVESIGAAIQATYTTGPEKHANCCAPALSKLTTTQTIERVLELYLAKREEGNLLRTASVLLRFSGSAGIGKAIVLLEEEKSTANRLALIRLIGRIGPAALEEARKCLKDERWYVVRNACKLLGQLKDPELVPELATVLRHPEERVQKAALDAIRESRDPRSAAALAEALPFLRPQPREEALNELLLLRDPASVPALDRMIFSDPKGNLPLVCVQALAAIPGDAARRALLHVISSPGINIAARRLALTALVRAKSTEVETALREYATSATSDDMAQEMLKALAAK